MRISVDRLRDVSRQGLIAAGLPARHAGIAAEALVTTDTWGILTHGTKNLPGYIRRIRAGGIRARAHPKIIRQGPAWAIIDGDSALGMVASVFAMKTAISRARRAGIGYVGVRNSCHFGAAGYYASLALKSGMMGMAMCNDTPTVAIPGSARAVLGSNPLAVAVPAGKEHPILLDIATSTVAGGKVFAAAAQGKKIPRGWLVDRRGLPTQNPALFPDRASLTSMAGHKGYGIALVIEILSAVLTGAAIGQHVLSWSFDNPTLPTGHGAAFIAVDISRIASRGVFQKRMDQTIREIRAAPKARSRNQVYLPGEMEWEKRKRALREGVEISRELWSKLRELAGSPEGR